MRKTATPRVIRGARQRLSRKPRIHVMHVRKAAGSALKTALMPVALDGPYHLVMRSPVHKLADIPAGEQVVFVMRDPLTRYVSGFNGRKFKAGHEEKALTVEEIPIFDRFATANDLAEALSSTDPDERAAAEGAMRTVNHFTPYATSIGSEEELCRRRDDIFMLLFQETLADDLTELTRRLGVDASLPGREEWRANTAHPEADTSLSKTAMANLERWFQDDIRYYELCRRIRNELDC